jgi:flagellar hook-associated protein 3 FlgL
MRVSDKMLFQSNTIGLQRNADALLKAQARVASGRRVSLPSDDPVSAARISNFNAAIGRMNQHLRNGDHAKDFLSVTDSALSAVQEQVHKISELAVDMADGSKNPQDFQIAAGQLKPIFEQIAMIASTTHTGQYIFSGNQIATKPFDFNKDWHGKAVGTTLFDFVDPNASDTLEIIAPNPDDPTVIANDRLRVVVDGEQIDVTLTEGEYTGEEIAHEVETQIRIGLGTENVTVSFVLDSEDGEAGHLEAHSVTIRGQSGIVFNPVDDPPGGDARAVLGFLNGKSELSGEEYLGDGGQSAILIEPSASLSKNITGSQAFKGGPNGVDIFASLFDFQTALETGNAQGAQKAIADMEKATEQISAERAKIGARLNRLDETRTRIEALTVSIKESKSNEEDIDLTQAISDMVQAQNALAASQSVLARILSQPTLLSFLR